MPARMEGVAFQDPLYSEKSPFPETERREGLNRVVGAAWIKAAPVSQKRGDGPLVKLNEKEKRFFPKHKISSLASLYFFEVTYVFFRRFSCCFYP